MQPNKKKKSTGKAKVKKKKKELIWKLMERILYQMLKEEESMCL